MRLARLSAGAAIAATCFAVAACGGSDDGGSGGSGAADSADGGGSLKGKQAVFTIFESGLEDEFRAAFITPAEQETGLKVAVDAPTDYAKFETQVKSGNVSWTVSEGDAWWAFEQCGKLLEKIDVPVENLPEKYELSGCDVPGNTWALNLTYDSKKFATDPPKGWADFFDTAKYPGKRAVWGSYIGNGLLEGALLADGVTPEALYPLDVDRAFKKLDTIKKDMAFFDTLAQATEMMQSNSAAMVLSTNNTGYQAAKAGSSFKPIWNQAILSYDSYIVPKGGDVEAAKAILKYVASKEGQQKLVEGTTFGPTRSDVEPHLPADKVEWSPATPENEKQTIPFNQRWWSENFADVSARWTDWVSG